MSNSLEGKTAIVTGSCNGIGQAIARTFADAGANVMMAGVNEVVLDEEAERLGGLDKGIATFTGDLAEKLTVANLMAATIGAFDRIDILVNANHCVLFSDPLETNGDVLEELLARNVTGTFRLSRRVAKRMIKQASEQDDDTMAGAVINISSILSECRQHQLTSYAISCAALNQLTQSLASTLAPHNIRVNAIAMGLAVNACLHAALKEKEEDDSELTELVSLPPVDNADDAADAALFLATDAQVVTTGQILEVNAGTADQLIAEAPT